LLAQLIRLANLKLVKFTHLYMDNPEEIQIPESTDMHPAKDQILPEWNTDIHPAKEQIMPAGDTDIHQEGEHGQPEEILNSHPTAKTPKLSDVSELSKTLRRGTRLAISAVLITIASISVTEAGSTTTDAKNDTNAKATIETVNEDESFNLSGIVSAQLEENDLLEWHKFDSHLPKQDNTQISGYSEKRISRFIGQRQLQDLRLELARQDYLSEISGSNIPIRGTEDQEELDRLSRMLFRRTFEGILRDSTGFDIWVNEFVEGLEIEFGNKSIPEKPKQIETEDPPTYNPEGKTRLHLSLNNASIGYRMTVPAQPDDIERFIEKISLEPRVFQNGDLQIRFTYDNRKNSKNGKKKNMFEGNVVYTHSGKGDNRIYFNFNARWK